MSLPLPTSIIAVLGTFVGVFMCWSRGVRRGVVEWSTGNPVLPELTVRDKWQMRSCTHPADSLASAS